MPAIGLLLFATGLLAPAPKEAATAEHPLSNERRRQLSARLEQSVRELTGQIERQPESVQLYSSRGDALFFLARFDEAVADYDQMVTLDPELDNRHWRRGIAYFYAGKYQQAARQFEVYHTFDNVDRENGIWRFLSQARAHGIEQAREGLLEYEKDDREPFPQVYRLFAGQTTPAGILNAIRAAMLDDRERDKRLFYAHLYIGLNFAILDKTQLAEKHLRQAVANPWGADRRAGYGPHYMWHVARVHYERLTKQPRAERQSGHSGK